MRYTAHIELEFEYEVPGDDPNDSHLDRNIATAGGATSVWRKTLDLMSTPELASHLLQYEGAAFTSWATPEAKDEAA